MQLIALVFVALAAGYAGGWLAGRWRRTQDEAELRGAVEALLSELTVTAAEAVQEVAHEREKLESLLSTVYAQLAEREIPGERPGDDKPAGAAELEKEVLALAGAGKDPATIAQAVGLGRGEVELMLNLARR